MSHVQSSQTEESVKVAVRIRPLTDGEKTRGNEEVWRYTDKAIQMYKSFAKSPADATTYAFDHVFGTGISTRALYNEVCGPVIRGVMNGINGTVFAYGQTSSGKTFTCQGTQDNPGLIVLSLREVFNSIQRMSEREFLLRVSYLEVYNEVINDLLNPENRNLSIKDEKGGRGIYVDGAQESIVTTAQNVLELLGEGEEHRHVGATNMNEYSSRSHTIFRMVIESKDRRSGDEGAVRVSTLQIVDLAGSERASKSGAEGARLKEGANINKSLMVLGQVITSLSEGGKYDESLSTLRFASRAKNIKNKTSVNEIMDDKALIRRYKKEIEELKTQLAEARAGTGGPQPTVPDGLQRQISDLSHMIMSSANMSGTEGVPQLPTEGDQGDAVNKLIGLLSHLRGEKAPTHRIITPSDGPPNPWVNEDEEISAKLPTDVLTLQSELKKEREKRARLIQEKKELEKRLRGAEEAVGQMTGGGDAQTLHALTRQLKEESKRSKEKAREVKQLTAKLESANRKVQLLKDTASSMKEAAKSKSTTVDSVTRDLTEERQLRIELEEDIEAMAKERNEMEGELEQRNSRIEALEQELEQARRSQGNDDGTLATELQAERELRIGLEADNIALGKDLDNALKESLKLQIKNEQMQKLLETERQRLAEREQAETEFFEEELNDDNVPDDVKKGFVREQRLRRAAEKQTNKLEKKVEDLREDLAAESKQRYKMEMEKGKLEKELIDVREKTDEYISLLYLHLSEQFGDDNPLKGVVDPTGLFGTSAATVHDVGDGSNIIGPEGGSPISESMSEFGIGGGAQPIGSGSSSEKRGSFLFRKFKKDKKAKKKLPTFF